MKRIIRKYGPPIFHCINDFGQGSLAALIPFFIANFGLNYYQSASIIFCNTVVASVAQPVLGYVADRWRVPDVYKRQLFRNVSKAVLECISFLVQPFCILILGL